MPSARWGVGNQPRIIARSGDGRDTIVEGLLLILVEPLLDAEGFPRSSSSSVPATTSARPASAPAASSAVPATTGCSASMAATP